MVRIAGIFLAMLCFASLLFAAEREKRFDIPIEGSPVMGPPAAPVTIVEFLDYQ